MQKDLVSIIVPVYNREQYVAQTLDSILQQTYPNIEIIAVNDGSTDGSLAILQQYQFDNPDKIVLIDQKNQGQVVSRNNAILHSHGEFIAFLDSDDLWTPDKLEKQIPLFQGNVALVYSGIHEINEDGEIINTVLCEKEIKGDIHSQLLIKNRMTGGSVVILRDAIDKVGLFDTDFPAAENWDLWIRVCRHYHANYINEPLVLYRKHAGNMSRDKRLMLGVIEKILEKHCSEAPKTEKDRIAYQEARANYHYRKGIYYFSEQNFKYAKSNFEQTLKLCPDYKDTRSRLFRSYLGKHINGILSSIKSFASKN